MRLESPTFKNGQPLPAKFTEDGDNVSPPLRWSDVPAGAVEFVLIVDDPDAPRDEPWVHWVIYRIPGDARELPEGVPRRSALTDPPGAQQGVNSWRQNNIGYRGPAPPIGHGPHRYCFRLYALGRPLQLASGKDKKAVAEALDGHVLDQAELIGTYERG